jgi:hypothetical protein
MAEKPPAPAAQAFIPVEGLIAALAIIWNVLGIRP